MDPAELREALKTFRAVLTPEIEKRQRQVFDGVKAGMDRERLVEEKATVTGMVLALQLIDQHLSPVRTRPQLRNAETPTPR